MYLSCSEEYKVLRHSLRVQMRQYCRVKPRHPTPTGHEERLIIEGKDLDMNILAIKTQNVSMPYLNY